MHEENAREDQKRRERQAKERADGRAFRDAAERQMFAERDKKEREAKEARDTLERLEREKPSEEKIEEVKGARYGEGHYRFQGTAQIPRCIWSPPLGRYCRYRAHLMASNYILFYRI